MMRIAVFATLGPTMPADKGIRFGKRGQSGTGGQFDPVEQGLDIEPVFVLDHGRVAQ